MNAPRIVQASEATGLNMSLHPAGPKWTIRCGACPATFRSRVPKVDNPSVQCPSCRVWNSLPFVWSAE